MTATPKKGRDQLRRELALRDRAELDSILGRLASATQAQIADGAWHQFTMARVALAALTGRLPRAPRRSGECQACAAAAAAARHLEAAAGFPEPATTALMLGQAMHLLGDAHRLNETAQAAALQGRQAHVMDGNTTKRDLVRLELSAAGGGSSYEVALKTGADPSDVRKLRKQMKPRG